MNTTEDLPIYGFFVSLMTYFYVIFDEKPDSGLSLLTFICLVAEKFGRFKLKWENMGLSSFFTGKSQHLADKHYIFSPQASSMDLYEQFKCFADLMK